MASLSTFRSYQKKKINLFTLMRNHILKHVSTTMRRMLSPWDYHEDDLIDYLRQLELEVEVMTGLLTEEQKRNVSVIMADLSLDRMMLDPELWQDLECH